MAADKFTNAALDAAQSWFDAARKDLEAGNAAAGFAKLARSVDFVARARTRLATEIDADDLQAELDRTEGVKKPDDVKPAAQD